MLPKMLPNVTKYFKMVTKKPIQIASVNIFWMVDLKKLYVKRSMLIFF